MVLVKANVELVTVLAKENNATANTANKRTVLFISDKNGGER